MFGSRYRHDPERSFFSFCMPVYDMLFVVPRRPALIVAEFLVGPACEAFTTFRAMTLDVCLYHNDFFFCRHEK